MPTLEELARRLHVLEAIDVHPYQRKLRILQSMWRDQRGYEIGIHRSRAGDRPLGSRLAMPWAESSLANFLTAPIADVVRDEVLNPQRSRGKLFARQRIFNDLLSSQPLAFNLFAIPSRDPVLATNWIRLMTGDQSIEVLVSQSATVGSAKKSAAAGLGRSPARRQSAACRRLREGPVRHASSRHQYGVRRRDLHLPQLPA